MLQFTPHRILKALNLLLVTLRLLHKPFLICYVDVGSFPSVPVVLTRFPDVQMSIQRVSKLRGALSEVCFCHGAQIPPGQLLKHRADLWQPVQVLGPE